MRTEVDSSAVYTRSVGPSPAERFADVDRERRRQLDELCRPVPGARTERKERFGKGSRRRGHGDQLTIHLWLDADLQLEMGQQAIRRGVSTSAIVREAWALAKPDLRKMPGGTDTRKHRSPNSVNSADVAYRLRFCDEIQADQVREAFGSVSRDHAYALLSRGVKEGLFERIGVGVYRPTAVAKALRGAA